MTVVYVPSRGRPDNVVKLAKAWAGMQGDEYELIFVVEPQDCDRYQNALQLISDKLFHRNFSTTVLALPADNMGIGYARKYIVDHADFMGHESIFLSDDDIKPDVSTFANYIDMANLAKNNKVLGITARYSYHDFALGPKIKKCESPILLPAGTFRLIALNVGNAFVYGNYDTRLTCVQEDGDLMLRGIELGTPWLIHLGTRAQSIGARYAPGGLSHYFGDDDANRVAAERKCHELLKRKHPDYVNDPPSSPPARGNGVRIKWQKAYDDSIENWKQLSYIHGGSIEEYLK